MKISSRMHFHAIWVVGFLSFLCINLSASDLLLKKADMVIFSYDRPMQLYAFLESVQLYMTGVGQMHVIFRASDERYAQAYAQVQHDFPAAIFTSQGKNPREDFKPLTLKASFESPNEYIIYAVDDIIVKDFIDLSICIDLLEKTRAWGFYLRLGTNLSECYSLRCGQAVPQCAKVCEDVIGWNFHQGSCDWRYPHTVDMTVYCKKDIEQDVRQIGYAAPNSFEGAWAARRPARPLGLCYERSKIVNLPLNRVQSEANNRDMHALTPAELLERFERGERIAINTLFKVPNKAAHMEYVPEFVMH